MPTHCKSLRMNERINNSFFQSPFWASVFGQEPHCVDRCRSVRQRAKANTPPQDNRHPPELQTALPISRKIILVQNTTTGQKKRNQPLEQDKEKQLQTRIGLDWIGLVSSKLCTYERAFTITVCIRTQCYVMAFIDLFPILFLVVPFRSVPFRAKQNKTQHNKTTRNKATQGTHQRLFGWFLGPSVPFAGTSRHNDGVDHENGTRTGTCTCIFIIIGSLLSAAC